MHCTNSCFVPTSQSPYRRSITFRDFSQEWLMLTVTFCTEQRSIRFFEFFSGMAVQFSSGRLTIRYYLDESENGKSKFSGKREWK